MSAIVRYKKLREDAKAPYRATDGAAGYDLCCVSVEYDDTDSIIYHTGLAFEIPEWFVGMLFPRSSLYRKNLIMPYSIGIIDSDYRGEVLAIYKPLLTRSRPFHQEYQVGERCCQLVIVQLPTVLWKEAQELTETTRGSGGHGSTGDR